MVPSKLHCDITMSAFYGGFFFVCFLGVLVVVGLDSLWGLKESDTTERLSLTQGTVKSRCKENLELPLFAGVKEIV